MAQQAAPQNRPPSSPPLTARRWTALLESLPEEEKQRLQRSMGLKMEQLKAEFDVLKNTHLE